MRPSEQNIRSGLLLVPFVFLFLWFRFEHFFHLHLHFLLTWILLSYGMIYVLIKMLRGKGKIPIVSLWVLISILVTVDFFQQSSYENYSDKMLLSELQRNTDEVKSRAQKLLGISEKRVNDMEAFIRRIDQPSS